MQHLAALLMLIVGGNATPSAADVTKVIEAAGGAVDEEKLTALLAELEGKDVNEILASGMEKLKSCNVSGAAPAAAAGAAPAAAAAPAAKPKEEEVDALEGGMNMFGGDGADY